MHVLLLTPYYPPLISGAGTYLTGISRALIEAGHRVTVVSMQGETGPYEYEGVTVRIARSSIRRMSSVMTLVESLRLHRSCPVDVVLSGIAYPTGVVGMLAAKLIRRPSVVVVLGEEVTAASSSKVASLLLRQVLRSAARVMPISSNSLREAELLGCQTAKCTVVPPYVDDEDFVTLTAQREAFRIKHGLVGKFVVLTVARLEERKGHDVVIRALATLRNEFERLHYLIVGQGDPSRLRQIADQYGLSSSMTILSSLADGDYRSAFAAADLFVMVSRAGATGDVDGFGIVYLEAAASDLPCIAGTVGGCADAVVDCVTGFTVDPLDVEAVAAALRALMESPERSARMGIAGHERVRSTFSKQQFDSSVLNILKEFSN